MSNWKEIWSKRVSSEISDSSVLQNLIFSNGFDTQLGKMEEGMWRDYINSVRINSGVVDSDVLLEIGCGSGAFLYPFWESGNKIIGIDISQSLLEKASISMVGNSDFIFCEAIDLKEEFQAHYCFANHVFHYFPNCQYAFKVLDKMRKIAMKKIYLLGIPDFDCKKESEQFRRGKLSEKEYMKKYDGLDLLYFNKMDFIEFAYKHQMNVEFYKHNMPGFVQNEFRYDVVFTIN